MLEDKFLRDQAFLTGSYISVADLMAITELMHVSAVVWGDLLDDGEARGEVGVLARAESWLWGLDKSLFPLSLSLHL